MGRRNAGLEVALHPVGEAGAGFSMLPLHQHDCMMCLPRSGRGEEGGERQGLGHGSVGIPRLKAEPGGPADPSSLVELNWGPSVCICT